MNAEIIDQDDRGIGVRVIDNQEKKHTVAVGFGGEIQGHSQDGYSDDPSERTPNENEHVTQAREFARHHVYKETEHEPFPVEKNLPGVERAKTAIDSLSQPAFEELFTDLYKQVKGNGPEVERPVAYPPSVDTHDPVIILQDIYTDVDGEIEAVSDIHLQYQDENSSEAFIWNDDPFPDRKADARIQMMPSFSPSLEVFKQQVIYHLRCQLRDCYIGAGMEPPEAYRVLGFGQHKIDRRYRNPDITLYEEYSEPHADIPGYDYEFDYGVGELGRSVIILNSLRKADPQIRAVIANWEEAERGLEKTALWEQLAGLCEKRGYNCPDIFEVLSENDPDLDEEIDNWFDEAMNVPDDIVDVFAEMFSLTPAVEEELKQFST